MKSAFLFVLMCGASFSAYACCSQLIPFGMSAVNRCYEETAIKRRLSSYKEEQSTDLINVINAASQHGIIAPGSLVEIQSENFTAESTYAEFPGDLPTELDGVSVSIDGVLCRLWYVTPQHIQAIVPDFPIRTSYRFGWKQVEVKCKDGRLLHGWAVVLPVAPGIVFQQGMPQGLWNVPHTEHVGVIAADEPIPAGATVALTGTGFKLARNVVVYLMTDTEWFAVTGKVGPFAVSGFYWLQTVSFDLPPQAVGRVSVIIAADQVNWTQEFGLTIQ